MVGKNLGLSKNIKLWDLEQCKYKLKKRKIVNFIDDEIIDDEYEVIDDDEISKEERQKIIDELRL